MTSRASIAVFLFVSSVVGHSWLQCADYRISSAADEMTFDINKCKGWPRGWYNLNDKVLFGADNGYNYQPGSGGSMCQQAFPSGGFPTAYNAAYPYSTYSPGQNVCMAWPTKNHVAASCDNSYIPDNGLVIYMTAVNPTSNPTSSNTQVAKNFGKNTRADQYFAFQHCPNFCNNKDKATCTGCFVIPANTAPGWYTFAWQWAFNGPNDIYSNCFDAMITGDPITNQPTSQPQTSQQQTSQPQTSQQQQPTSQQQQPTSQQQQPTSQQQPITSGQQTTPQTNSGGTCISQCQLACGSRGIETCDCSNGINVKCASESASSGWVLSISAITAVLAYLM